MRNVAVSYAGIRGIFPIKAKNGAIRQALSRISEGEIAQGTGGQATHIDIIGIERRITRTLVYAFSLRGKHISISIALSNTDPRGFMGKSTRRTDFHTF